MLHLISDNSTFFGSATLVLSTVEYPKLCSDEYSYETCLFAGEKNSEVIAKYRTIYEAISGHERFRKEFGLPG